MIQTILSSKHLIVQNVVSQDNLDLYGHKKRYHSNNPIKVRYNYHCTLCDVYCVDYIATKIHRISKQHFKKALNDPEVAHPTIRNRIIRIESIKRIIKLKEPKYIERKLKRTTSNYTTNL